MPKLVDHAARRSELARAVWLLVGRAGIEAATVRAVATESGWSMGAVRHYFASQEELLRFACEEMEQRVVARIRSHYEGGRRDGPDPQRAVRALAEMLPMDPDRRVEVLVWLAFMTRARTDPALDDIRESAWIGERYLCRLALADARGLPLPVELTDSLEAEHERDVEQLHLLVDGLSVQGVTNPERWPPERLRASLTAAVERLA